MTDWPYPLWIAHRGAGKLAPENTLAAFRLGAAHGYRAFECDVKLSADGVPFLLHDATLERTTPERGMAGERPWAELSRLDAGGWHSRAYAGEPLPSLEAIAALRAAQRLCAEHRDQAHAGHRAAPPARSWPRHAARLWHGAAVPPLLSSFRPEALQGAREAAPQLPRALLLDTLWPGWFEMAQRARLRGRGDQPQADGRALLARTARAPACARWLHGERAGRRAAAAGAGHRRPDHRRGRPLLAARSAVCDCVQPRRARRRGRTSASAPSQSSPSRAGQRCSSRITGMPPGHQRQQQRHAAGKDQRRAQADVLAEPAAEQRARAGGQQDQPAHRARHAAEQRLGRHRLAQRQEVDEDQHRAQRRTAAASARRPPRPRRWPAPRASSSQPRRRPRSPAPGRARGRCAG